MALPLAWVGMTSPAVPDGPVLTLGGQDKSMLRCPIWGAGILGPGTLFSSKFPAVAHGADSLLLVDDSHV